MTGTPVAVAARVDAGASTSATVTATITAQTTAGSTLFAVVRCAAGQRPAGVVDSLGRAFTQAAAGGTTATTVTVFTLVQDGGTLAPGATVAITSTVNQPQMIVFEVADLDTLDQTATAVRTTNTTDPLTVPATPATTTAPQVAFAMVAQGPGAVAPPTPPPTGPAGWTALDVPAGGTFGVVVAVAWQTVNTPGPVGPVTWTPDGSRNMAGLTVTWRTPPGPALTITTTSLPDATVGQPYSATLTAEGGVPPYSWAVTQGSLPAGLSLDPSTGAISGTPTQPSPT